jgi:membrane-associated phospholipid phosphatase
MKARHWLVAAVAALALQPRSAAALDSWQVNATDVLTGVVPLGALWLTHAKDDRAGRDQYLWSMGTTLVVVTSARVLFNDHAIGERPNGNPYGFPSGHLAFFGAGAAFLQDRYGWRWGVPAWAAAGWTAYVRVEDDHHRWRDVVVASAVAAGVSRYFVTPYPDLTVKPLFRVGAGADHAAGLEFTYRFR